MWVPQWPLPSEKLKAAKELVQEQLDLGHVEPTQSPWNTPIFVVKKKSGKWRLLHDLRAINAQMQVMGPVQRGLPLLSALPKDWRIIVVDIKDCFFSIPLNKKDKPRFAFTLPSINHMEPDKRYQWRVLPQGMANSPTICQLYVGKALQPVRDGFPSLKICHYMDDIVICGPEEESIQQAYGLLNETLKNNGLSIAPEKVQQSNVSHFLGATITLRCVTPQKISIRKDHLKTLNDFQKLLGDIVLQCGKCVEFINAPSVGVNPRGLRPLDVWQMDVTHIPSFGKLQYVHVSIDTSSGVLHASPLTGEKAVHVISHCLEAWAAWGKPLVLKTDNGPAYTSSKFSQFCKQMQVKHITGLPYNPQGQGIIERAHRTLKQYLQKQKGGIEAMTPKMALSLAIFTLNF